MRVVLDRVSNSIAEALGTPLIAATFPVPKIALLPLLILWLGLGEPSKVAVIALGVFFPMAINTSTGGGVRPTRCSCAPPSRSARGAGASSAR